MKTVNEAREALSERMKTSVGRPFLADLECERLMEAADAYALAAAQRVIEYDTDHEPDYFEQGEDRSLYCCSYHRLEWELGR